jgi:hypothetical protein
LPSAAEAAQESSSRLVELVSGLAGGAASRASKELLLHPIDTIKVRPPSCPYRVLRPFSSKAGVLSSPQTRLQYARGDTAPEDLFKDLYSGVWPALLVGTPAGP